MDKRKDNLIGTLVAVFCIVAGWVMVSNLPRLSEGASYARTSGVDWANWQPWTGIILLSLGTSYFVLFRPWKNSNGSTAKDSTAMRELRLTINECL